MSLGLGTAVFTLHFFAVSIKQNRQGNLTAMVLIMFVSCIIPLMLNNQNLENKIDFNLKCLILEALPNSPPVM